MKSINIPGLLVEYIISGTVAYIWILLIIFSFPSFQNILSSHTTIITFLAIPFAYVLGMVIDMIAYILVRESKDKIKEGEINKIESKKPEIKFLYSESEKKELSSLIKRKSLTDRLVIELNANNFDGLINEINWRSSRDRIARGFIVNSFLIGISVTLNCSLWFYNSYETNTLGIAAVIFIGIVISIFIAYLIRRIWKNCEKLSLRFQFLTYFKVIKNRELLS